MYWIAVIVAFLAMRYNEKKGHWPLMKAKAPARRYSDGDESPASPGSLDQIGKTEGEAVAVRSIDG